MVKLIPTIPGGIPDFQGHEIKHLNVRSASAYDMGEMLVSSTVKNKKSIDSRWQFAQMSSSVIRYLDTQVNWPLDKKPQFKSPQGCPLWGCGWLHGVLSEESIFDGWEGNGSCFKLDGMFDTCAGTGNGSLRLAVIKLSGTE